MSKDIKHLGETNSSLLFQVNNALANIKLDDINNPGGDKEFNFANKHLHFKWVAPAAGAHQGAFELEASGAFANDLVHIHQHTGNPGATNLLYIEAADNDVTPLKLVHGASNLDFNKDGLILSADARITEFDSGALAASDTVAPTSNAVKTYIDALLGIGIANKQWITLLREGEKDSTAGRVVRYYNNLGGTDMDLTFGLPIPLTLGAKNLYITQTNVGLLDADNGDELDRLRWWGYADGQTEAAFLDTGAGLDEFTVNAAGYTWNHADTQCGTTYRRIALYLECINTNANDLDISYVRVEYYYA